MLLTLLLTGQIDAVEMVSDGEPYTVPPDSIMVPPVQFLIRVAVSARPPPIGQAAHRVHIAGARAVITDPPVADVLNDVAPMPNRINGSLPNVFVVQGGGYENNAHQLGQGKRLYDWFNCKGCHANGGGSGPALTDAWWRYGPDPMSIFLSIRDGHPRGMPAYANKLTTEQIWQLAAYIRTMGAYSAKTAASGRNDEMQSRPAASLHQSPDATKPIGKAQVGIVTRSALCRLHRRRKGRGSSPELVAVVHHRDLHDHLAAGDARSRAPAAGSAGRRIPSRTSCRGHRGPVGRGQCSGDHRAHHHELCRHAWAVDRRR